MPYVPNATDTAEPLESQTVESAALEFRTLKTRVNALEVAVTTGDATDLRVPETAVAVIPTIANRAGKVLGFDAGGDPVAVAVAGVADPSLRADLAASLGAMLLGWIQTGTGAIARTIASKFYDTLSIKDFGGFAGASAAVNTAALHAAIAEAVVRGKGGVDIGPGGVWAFTAGANFASRDVAIIGVGKPLLDYDAGVGKGFVLDAGGAGANIRGMRMKNFIIKGGPSITNAFEHRGIVTSIFEDIEVRECTDVGFELRFGVLNTYKNLRVSNDSLAMTTTPLYSFRLRNDAGFGITASIGPASTTMTVTATADVLGAGQTVTGAGVTAGTVIVSQLTGTTGSTGTYSVNNSQTVGSESMTIGSANRMQANTFINADASGKGATSTSTGFKLDDATLNVFKGGTAESLLRGIDVGSACRLNTFEGTDLEHNVNEDIVDDGTGTVLNGVSSAGGGTAAGVQLTGHGATFTGGAYAIINRGSGSTDSMFFGVGIASAGGFTGTGPYKRLGCYTLDNAGFRNGTLSDIIGEDGVWTPTIIGNGTPGTQTYSLQKGQWYKAGKLVTFTAYINLSTNSGGTGNALLYGLPFVPQNIVNMLAEFTFTTNSGVTYTATYTRLAAELNPTLNYANIRQSINGLSPIALPIANIGAGTYSISGSYLTD